MPIPNFATLLENIVLVEAAQLVFAETESEQVVEFVNPFAMPPLSPWQDGERDRGFDAAHLARIAGGSDRTGFSTYMALLATALQPDQSRGPSGAFLVGLLARLAGKRVRMWLNDLPDDQGAHYPSTITGLQEFVSLLDAARPTAPSRLTVEVCQRSYPDSLDHLKSTISTWRADGAPAARVGYLALQRGFAESR